ncbi:DUF2062 domain-containing protein [Haliea sp. E17]|uniref:DUF2062 domain-containing protein n=1 Tax=Haliea sp. E17 TaxID=3401576 RepID=UPI003AB0B0E9
MRNIRSLLRRYKALSGDPLSLSSGSSLGAFLAILPVFPFRSMLIVLICPLVRGNVIACFLVATVLANPLLLPLWYYLCLLLGNWLTPMQVDIPRVLQVIDASLKLGGLEQKVQSIVELGLDTVVVLMVGGLVLATPIAVTVFVGSYKIFTKSEELKRNKPSV